MGLQILFINLTPLHVAAKNGYQRIVQLLIESGANFNAQTQMILIIFNVLWRNSSSFCSNEWT